MKCHLHQAGFVGWQLCCRCSKRSCSLCAVLASAKTCILGGHHVKIDLSDCLIKAQYPQSGVQHVNWARKVDYEPLPVNANPATPSRAAACRADSARCSACSAPVTGASSGAVIPAATQAARQASSHLAVRLTEAAARFRLAAAFTSSANAVSISGRMAAAASTNCSGDTCRGPQMDIGTRGASFA